MVGTAPGLAVSRCFVSLEKRIVRDHSVLNKTGIDWLKGRTCAESLFAADSEEGPFAAGSHQAYLGYSLRSRAAALHIVCLVGQKKPVGGGSLAM